jgi:hypothetical protein
MAVETTREKVLYYALVPVIAAAAGAFITSILQGQTCLPAGGADLVAILKDNTMSGAQKLQALEVYKDVTGRPWSVISSVSGSIMGIGGFLAAYLATRSR